MVQPPLLVLTLPRAYSSVVCTMIGRHPQLYGFPELNLFLADNVDCVLKFCQSSWEQGQMHNPFPPGLLRSLAELVFGCQTEETIQKVHSWLDHRKHWTSKAILDHLLAAVAPRRGVEKSPRYSTNQNYLERLRSAYPSATYLYLTRHPITNIRSMLEFYQKIKPWSYPGGREFPRADYCARAWCDWHRNLLSCTRRLPPAQVMRVRGEDILKDPDVQLAKVAGWLGIRDDAEAVNAMKHPETSPYASFGPEGARVSGLDQKFQADPRLRGPAEATSLEVPPEWGVDPALIPEIHDLAAELGYE